MKTNPENPRQPAAAATHQPWLKVVESRVSALRFGTVQIVVHEGRVTQVDCTERTRIAVGESAAA